MSDTDAGEDRPATLTIDVVPPVQANGNVVSQLVLQEPTAGQVARAEVELSRSGLAGVRAYETALLALVTKADKVALKQLPSSQHMRAAAFLKDFVRANMPKRTEEDDEELGAPVLMSSDDYTLTLPEPILFGNDTVDSLTLTEPTLAQLEKAETHLSPDRMKGNAAASLRHYMMALVQVSSGVPMGVIHQMPISVLNKAWSIARVFTVADPATGTN